MNKTLIITAVLALTLVVGIYQYMTTNNTTINATTNLHTVPAAAPVQDDNAAQLAREEEYIRERQRKLRESAEQVR